MSFVQDVFDGIRGKTGAVAAKEAGEVQSEAAKYAADLQNEQFKQTRADMQPWLQAGKKALPELQSYIKNSADFGDNWGDRLNDAYSNGQLTGGLNPDQMQLDPSYQFRKKQGMDGIESSAAARGSLLSGATLKALNDYNSNLASQEYNNAWQRDQSQKQNLFSVLNNNRAQDYSLFAQEDQRKYNQLANMAGIGKQVAGQIGSLGANNAANVGRTLMGGANAQASGLVGAANSRQQGIQNMISIGKMIATGGAM